MTKTREQWLNDFVTAARPLFKDAGAPIPKNVRCSIGWPSTGRRSKRIGECWGTVSSDDGTFEIFIRPTIKGSSRIADILVHELIHAALGLEEGHGKQFKRVATALGLTGKMTATVAGPEFAKLFGPVLKKVGNFPAAAMKDNVQTVEKKQTTRLLKLECMACEWTCRTTKLHIEAHDELSCPTGCGGVLIQA